jgi:hypothetical protein
MPVVAKNEINLASCSCLSCPSYNECAKDKLEKLYCASEVGRSACKYKMNGCICGSCQVHKDNNLANGYYCLNGSAVEIG